MRSLCTVLLTAIAAQALPAGAADLMAEPRLAWSLPFGGTARVAEPPALLLALDVQGVASGDPAASIVQLNLAEAGASLRLAGLPLWGRSYRVSQDEDLEPVAELDEAAVADNPWYSRPWVFWTAGGVGLAAALAGGSGGDDEPDDGEFPFENGNNPDCEENGNGCGLICTDGECVVPTGFAIRQAMLRSSAAAAAPAPGLDAGTGQMGDLIAR